MHLGISKKIVSWWLSAMVMFAVCLMGMAKPAQAKVHVQGTVNVWRPDLNRWLPLQRARVRIVLAEDTDWDTGDVEATTDDNGFYHISKGNAWWRSGYKAYAIVFAESPNKLEVQEYYGQIDGYQATTGKIFAKDDKTSTLNVNITAPGGPAGNVSFQVGGLALLDNSSGTSATKGWRAFFIYQSMTAHRLGLMNRSLGSDDFEEKEVSYPASVDGSTAQYTGILDYIKVEDDAFTPGLPRASLGMRHEMSHAIMSDAYYTWPGIFHGSAGSHTLSTVAKKREFAWSEAWAEFLAEVSQRDAYGQGQVSGVSYGTSFNDFETQNGWLPNGSSWRSAISASADRSFIEGEIASAMWDIYDGRGTEKRMNQVAAIPGDEMFYDGIEDLQLAKIWRIMREYRPHSFTHESFLGSSDSFIWYWVHKTNNKQLHELKSILFNRGIRVNEIQQSAPTVTMGKITWNGTTASIPITVREPNAEDRPYLTAEVFVGGQKVAEKRLNEGWNGDTNNVVLSQQIAALKANTSYPVMVAVNDNMESDWKQQTVNVPPSAVIRGIGVTLHQLRVDNFYTSDPFKQEVGNARVIITVSDGKVSQDYLVPKTGELKTLKEGDTFFLPLPDQSISYNIFKSDAPTGTLKISMRLIFKAYAQGKAVPLQAFNSVTFNAEQAYGLGYHTLDAGIVTEEFKLPILKLPVPKRTKASLYYQVFAFEPNKPIDPMFIKGLFPTMTYFPILTKSTPPDTPNTKAPQTPTAMVSRANSLAKQHLRVQADLLEVAQELEWKLSPRGLQRRVAVPEGRAAATRRGADSADFSPLMPDDPARLLSPELLKKGAQQLTLPPTPFLDAAERGEGLVASLPTSARLGLGELQNQSRDLNARLGSINTQAASLRVALQNASAKMTALQFGTTGDSALRARMDEATQNLAAITSSATAFQKLGTREQAIIARGLQLPTATRGTIGRPDVTKIPVNPGNIGRNIPPIRRNPTDSTPAKPPIITIPRRPR